MEIIEKYEKLKTFYTFNKRMALELISKEHNKELTKEFIEKICQTCIMIDFHIVNYAQKYFSLFDPIDDDMKSIPLRNIEYDRRKVKINYDSKKTGNK